MNIRYISKLALRGVTRLCGLAAISLVVRERALADILAGPFVDPGNGHSYSLLNWTSWTASEAEAESLGGHLATIRNASENDWVYNTFQSYLPNLIAYPGDPSGTATTLWIGLNDLATPGKFQWASGEPVTYVNWFPGQPDNIGGERYVHIWTPTSLPQDPSAYREWNNFPNSATWLRGYGVVEVVPEPSTYALVVVGLLGLGYRYRMDRSIASTLQGSDRMIGNSE